MIIIFVTHPEAERVEPQGSFRPLTEKGIGDLKLVSEEILAYLKVNNLRNVSIVSSSAVRCVQTAFEVGNELRILQKDVKLEVMIVVSDKINTINDLNQSEDKTETALKSILEDLLLKIKSNSEVTIFSLHADIGGVLRQQLPESEVNKEGFLNSRPVFGILEVTKPEEGKLQMELLDCFRIETKKVSLKKSL